MSGPDWFLATGVIIAAATAIVVVCRFIFRLDAKVDLLVDKMNQFGATLESVARAVQDCIERTAKLEGRVDELSRKRDD